ncbi:MAG: GtrA family protein [Oscillospiraceae bacterium]|nr:GtrA family protein [Oscillospiraceae bacterium]
MFEKILQIFVKLLPKPLKDLYDKFEELIVYIYYGVLTTIVNTIVQFGIEFGLLSLVNWSDRIENLISTSVAWVVAVIFAFYVNKKYVFKSKTESTKQFMWEFWTFISARLASFAMSVGIMQLGVPLYSVDDGTEEGKKIFWIYFVFYFAQQVIVTLANYFLSKFIIFKKKKNPENSESR